MIKAIIFDFGGPVIEWEEGFKRTYKKHEQLRGLKDGILHDVFDLYTQKAIIGEYSSVSEFFEKNKPTINLTIKELSEIYDEANATMYLRPEMEKYIIELKNKYQIGLLSNFTFGLEKFLQEIFKIDYLFDVVVSSYDVKMKKPDPRIYEHTLEQFGVQPHEAIFIDDLQENVEGAIPLGINTMLFDSSKQCIADLNNLLEKDHLNAK